MKKLIITISIILLILLILFVPLPSGMYKDGGTKEYSALTYKIVKWHSIDSRYESGYYENTSVYWFPDNFKSIGELWDMEMQEN
ncbi:MAG: hypothetical protein E7384_00040 [Ruminococcaceae bacterium]|nr:hypothetical protein [Oscillospiraceae bacterium]